ncbi:MAG: MarR family winged helix-turn-helix transcriptional regulator [Rhizobiaceae bacterium]|jgi:DNA-binding MarR family transcriptional regulator
MATPRNTLNGFGYLLNDTSRLLRRRFEQKASNYNITSAQWRAMAQLSRSDGLTQVALAHLLEIEPMSVCRLIDRMEAGGFVTRQPDPADKRAKLVYLTEKSRALLDIIRVVAMEVYEDAFAGFDEDERLRLVAALNKINSNLSKAIAVREEEVA